MTAMIMILIRIMFCIVICPHGRSLVVPQLVDVGTRHHIGEEDNAACPSNFFVGKWGSIVPPSCSFARTRNAFLLNLKSACCIRCRTTDLKCESMLHPCDVRFIGHSCPLLPDPILGMGYGGRNLFQQRTARLLQQREVTLLQ